MLITTGSRVMPRPRRNEFANAPRRQDLRGSQRENPLAARRFGCIVLEYFFLSSFLLFSFVRIRVFFLSLYPPPSLFLCYAGTARYPADCDEQSGANVMNDLRSFSNPHEWVHPADKPRNIIPSHSASGIVIWRACYAWDTCRCVSYELWANKCTFISFSLLHTMHRRFACKHKSCAPHFN